MRPILNVVGISKRMELADYNYRPPPGGPPGGGAGLCARRSDVCIKNLTAPDPPLFARGVGRAYALAVCIKSGIAPVVGGSRHGVQNGPQERVAQNRHLLYYSWR